MRMNALEIRRVRLTRIELKRLAANRRPLPTRERVPIIVLDPAKRPLIDQRFIVIPALTIFAFIGDHRHRPDRDARDQQQREASPPLLPRRTSLVDPGQLRRRRRGSLLRLPDLDRRQVLVRERGAPAHRGQVGGEGHDVSPLGGNATTGRDPGLVSLGVRFGACGRSDHPWRSRRLVVCALRWRLGRQGRSHWQPWRQVTGS